MQNMEKLPTWTTLVVATPNRKAGEQEQHGEDRRSQGRGVMLRMGPRRSGLEWQESMRNRLQPGNANDERRQSLGASRSCRPMERSVNGHIRVLPSCPQKLGCNECCTDFIEQWNISPQRCS